jgi:hypothetical protein
MKSTLTFLFLFWIEGGLLQDYPNPAKFVLPMFFYSNFGGFGCVWEHVLKSFKYVIICRNDDKA